MKKLAEYNREYETILHSNSRNKAIKLANLMSEMEGQYKIPMVRNESWEQENRAVIALYRKISMSRDI